MLESERVSDSQGDIDDNRRRSNDALVPAVLHDSRSDNNAARATMLRSLRVSARTRLFISCLIASGLRETLPLGQAPPQRRHRVAP